MIRIIISLILVIITHQTVAITSPLVTPFLDNQLPYFYANFGQIPYGKSLAYNMVVLNTSLCDEKDVQHFTMPTYVVVKSGPTINCSFTKQALVAQSVGAKGVIISTIIASYASGNVIDGEDGNGKKVHITVLFIKNDHFDILKTLDQMEIITNYPVPKSQVTTLSLFLSASKRSSYVLVRNLESELQYFQDFVTIELIYETMECPYCNQINCLMTQFCTFDHEYYEADAGQQIIREQIRQYNIFKKYGTERWMEFMNKFDQQFTNNWANSERVAAKVMKEMRINDNWNSNPVETLRIWRSRETKIGFDNFPEIAANNLIYRGNLDIQDVVSFICSSLDSPPARCMGQVNKIDNFQLGTYHVIIASSALVLATVIICIGCCLYKKLVNRQLTDDLTVKVNELVAKYANKVSIQQKSRKERLAQRFEDEL